MKRIPIRSSLVVQCAGILREAIDDGVWSRWRPAAWILHRSTPEIQRWFSERTLPAVIAGTRHPGIRLPAVDIDHYACGCHAAGRLVARGLERLLIVREKTQLAGDLNCLCCTTARVLSASISSYLPL